MGNGSLCLFIRGIGQRTIKEAQLTYIFSDAVLNLFSLKTKIHLTLRIMCIILITPIKTCSPLELFKINLFSFVISLKCIMFYLQSQVLHTLLQQIFEMFYSL